MPRKPRFAPPGCFFHVTNRGNDRQRIFFGDTDYRGFLSRLVFAKQRYPVMLHGLCLMPNHFHAIVQPREEGALSAYMQWVSGNYACDLRSFTGTTGDGHIFQGRFWNDRITHERHFLNVLRYVEANPHVSQLVDRAEDWPWSSLQLRDSEPALLDPLPLRLPANWPALVNQSQPPDEVERIEKPMKRGRPQAARATKNRNGEEED
jgi:putative transposase